MPDVTGQKWQLSSRNGRTERSATICTRNTLKHTSGTSVVDVYICQKPHYKVKVEVDDKKVVDAAAEVAILSEDVFNAMKVKQGK